MKILLTGGAGYIGTHIAVELYATGHEAIIVDNLSNSSASAVKAVEKIVGKNIPFYEYDCRDSKKLEIIFESERPDAAIHLASFKSVKESIEHPLEYWDNNINTTISLLKAMSKANCKNIVFSSSATVYGAKAPTPCSEDTPTGNNIANPYGETKCAIERILKNLYASDPSWKITILRYFNPIGAHSSGLIGENPKGVPNNIMPYISQVAVGKLPILNIFGDDYDTPDGTCIRDYIHVVDLAKGHVSALNNSKENGCRIYNLGTGEGVSVKELLSSYETVIGRTIPSRIAPRRAGDIAELYADPSKANRELKWKTAHSVKDACESANNWESLSAIKEAQQK